MLDSAACSRLDVYTNGQTWQDQHGVACSVDATLKLPMNGKSFTAVPVPVNGEWTLDASYLVTEENAATFEELYAIAWESGEETMLPDSILALLPTVQAAPAACADDGLYRIAAVEAR